MKRLRDLTDYTSRDSLAVRLRRRRFELFKKLLGELRRPLRVLDVGGTEAFWRQMEYADEPDVSIVVLNLERQDVSAPGISSVIGDARAMPEFGDREFDVVFSNSVIEHLGRWEDQMQMAGEVRRVGERFFIQTPNRYFPIEPHALLPGFQFLPVTARAWLLQHFALGHLGRSANEAAARRVVESIRLLTRGEMGRLFPGAAIVTERFVGLPKSFVALGGWSRQPGARQ